MRFGLNYNPLGELRFDSVGGLAVIAMATKLGNHELERRVQHDKLLYECSACGLTGKLVSEFERYSCDEYRHNPARKDHE